METLLDDGDQHIDRHRDPDLRLDRVLRRAEETFEAKVLLDPLEEQLHLPASLEERADGQCREGQLVGEKDERLVGLGVLEANTAQCSR